MRWLRLARATSDARLPQPYDCQLPGIAMNSTSRPGAVRQTCVLAGWFRLIADAGLVFTNVCFQTGAAIRGEICNAIVSLHDNPTDAPSVSGLAD